jgi:hypothetical protein
MGTFYGQFLYLNFPGCSIKIEYNHYIIGIYIKQANSGTEIVRKSSVAAAGCHFLERKSCRVRRDRLQI